MHEQLRKLKVKDRQTFIKFLDLLRKDFSANPENWGNKTIPDFLEAMSRFADDIQRYYDNLGLDEKADHPTWERFAHIIQGAKIYE